MVKAGVRNVSKGLGDLASNTTLLAADYSDRESMRAAFTGADVVSLPRATLVCGWTISYGTHHKLSVLHEKGPGFGLEADQTRFFRCHMLGSMSNGS